MANNEQKSPTVIALQSALVTLVAAGAKIGADLLPSIMPPQLGNAVAVSLAALIAYLVPSPLSKRR